ncbi:MULTISPECIES: hypothetical protein [Pseudomonas]|nr:MULTISPECIES: hypothetical protein [Pseudomonas]
MSPLGIGVIAVVSFTVTLGVTALLLDRVIQRHKKERQAHRHG